MVQPWLDTKAEAGWIATCVSFGLYQNGGEQVSNNENGTDGVIAPIAIAHTHLGSRYEMMTTGFPGKYCVTYGALCLLGFAIKAGWWVGGAVDGGWWAAVSWL